MRKKLLSARTSLLILEKRHKLFAEVNQMEGKYSGLYELMESDTKAKEYFDALPDYVKQSMEARQQNINSFASLEDYAQNLLRNE